jgi:hypothetical protein
LVSDEVFPDLEHDPYAEDAVVSTIYAVTAGLETRSQEVAWAAGRAVESAFHSLLMSDEVGGLDLHDCLTAHPLVQAELWRQ